MAEYLARRATDHCEYFDDCLKNREISAEFRGSLTTGIANINTGVANIWIEVSKVRHDVQSLYFRVGIISGGAALVVSIIASIVVSMIKGG